MDTEHQQLTSEIESAYGIPMGHDPRNPSVQRHVGSGSG